LLYNPFSHSGTEINVKDIFIYKNYMYFIYIFCTHNDALLNKIKTFNFLYFIVKKKNV